MRFLLPLLAALVLAAPASAASLRFGIFNLSSDLAAASHNEFGDVKASSGADALARKARGATLVRCAAECRFGKGWLAFSKGPGLTNADLVSAKAHAVRRDLWQLTVQLTKRGQSRWIAFSRVAAERAKRRGIPDVLVVVVDGQILAQPYANAFRRTRGTLELFGFTPAGARLAAKLLR